MSSKRGIKYRTEIGKKSNTLQLGENKCEGFIKVDKLSLDSFSTKVIGANEISEMKHKLKLFSLRNQFYDIENL